MENILNSPGVAGNDLSEDLAQFLDQSMDANIDMADFSHISFDPLPPYPQVQYPAYPGFPHYGSGQDAEARTYVC